MIEIRSLEGLPISRIGAAHRLAFSDYAVPMQKSDEQLLAMMKRRGYDAQCSFGAFLDHELLSFTLNGIGIWNGRKAAYDISTATVGTYRMRGLASGIFSECMSRLKNHGVEQYLLEVLRVNTGAVGLYEKLGFQKTRTLDYYIAEASAIQFPSPAQPIPYTFAPITNPDWKLFQSFWDFQPSWQNSIDAVSRVSNHFLVLGVCLSEELVGYGIMEFAIGDLPQIAIAKAHRRNGLATSLLQELIRLTESTAIRIINVEESDLPFKSFTRKLGLTPGHGQYEMLLEF